MQYQGSVSWKTEVNLLRAYRAELLFVTLSQIYLLFSIYCLN